MQNHPKGRILALDYGRKRIGLAVSDELGITAQGIETLVRIRIRDDIDRLAALATKRGAGMFLVGDPLHLSGEPGRLSSEAREFGERLRHATGLPVEYWDERLTSAQAGRVLRESGVSSRKRARAVDRMAAVLILESYLDWRSHAAASQEEPA